MRMNRLFATGLLALLVFATLGAQPADARRRFFLPGFGGGSGASERIENVYELPDRAPFKHDGEFFELGYLYSTRQSNGYVLYHGDKYLRLDPAMIAMIKADLGFDPTAAHRARLDAANGQVAESAPPASRPRLTSEEAGERGSAWAAERTRPSAESTVQPRISSGALFSGPAIIFLLMLVVGGFVLRRFVRSAPKREGNPWSDRIDQRSFEDRVAARLNEIQNAPPAPAPSAEMPPRAAGPRTFGRRVA